jgi:hypothetical protein
MQWEVSIMCKYFSIVLAVILLLTLPLTVYADVVIGNDFLYKNESQAKQIGDRHYGKRFIINSPEGYVIPKEEPGSNRGVPTETYSNKGNSIHPCNLRLGRRTA